MDKHHFLIAVLPRKSFTKIKEEYGVDWKEEDLKKFARLVVENKVKEVFMLLAKIGEENGLKGERLGAFMYDSIRTALFYSKAAEAISKMLKEERGVEK